MGKQFYLWCGLALVLAACGNNNGNNPYAYGVAGGGAVTNPPNNFRGGVCGLHVANDYNALASACNNQGGTYYGNGYGGCEQMVFVFLRKYPGINCTIQTSQGQMMTLNEPTIRMLMGNRGGYGVNPGYGTAPAPVPGYGPAPAPGYGPQPY